MRSLTADQREARFAEYLAYVGTLNRGQNGELRLTRMNRVANLRKDLMALLNRLIETRAEELAAAMLLEYAPERPPKPEAVMKGRLPIAERKRRKPVWIDDAARGRRTA